jgi:tetratricopeptide (TPR) repeat protein
MIVKNEEKNMRRLFLSLKDLITDYVIVDTGSTDRTIEVIKECEEEFKIKGNIFYKEFKDFGYNRTHSLNLAKKHSASDYVLLVDADMVLVNDGFSTDQLIGDVIHLQQKNNFIVYYNTRLFRRTVDIKCVGVTHEYYETPDTTTKQKLTSLWINDIGDGGCKTDKFERDIRLLTQGIVDEPYNGRYHFYLAQSYKDTQQYEKAIEFYTKRIKIDGWYEEVWYSHYRIAECYKILNNIDEMEKWVMKAYEYNPYRAEALYMATKYFRINSVSDKAYHYYKLGSKIPYPKNDVLFVEYNIYDYLFDYEYSIFGYYVKEISNDDILHTSLKLLSKNIDNATFENIFSNIVFYTNKLKGSIHNIECNHLKNLHSSSPCLIEHNDNYLLCIRNVNYKIEGTEYKTPDNIVNTRYCLHKLDKNYNRLSDKKLSIDTQPFQHNGYNVNGIEDIRIYNHNNKTYYIGNTQCYSKKGKVQIMTGELNFRDKKIELINNNIINTYENTCEKNWVFVENNQKLMVVYKWHPLTIGVIKDNKFNKVFEYNTPKLFSKFRGSTCGYEKDGKLWFVVHSVNSFNPRKYLHWFIVLDKHNLSPICYSEPFTFENQRIEYCLGLVYNDKLRLSYSTMDSSTRIIDVDDTFFRFYLV